jgi:hypothetical protein
LRAWLRPAGKRSLILEGRMMRRRSLLFTAAGLVALAISIGVRHWVHGGQIDIVSGFLMGVSIGLLILGLARPSRRRGMD